MCLQFWKSYKLSWYGACDFKSPNFGWYCASNFESAIRLHLFLMQISNCYIWVVAYNSIVRWKLHSVCGYFSSPNYVGYYNSNNGCVSWECIHIETNGAQFELLICHGKDKGLFVRAIDM